jgi:hypothetical protein
MRSNYHVQLEEEDKEEEKTVPLPGRNSRKIDAAQIKGAVTRCGGMARIRAKIYHKPIESLHRPNEAVIAEAKAHWRNA